MLYRVITIDLADDRPGQPCIMRMFLRAQDRTRWCVDMMGFQPHMYCDAPKDGDVEALVNYIISQGDIKGDIETEEIETQTLYGYQGNNLKKAVRLSFDSDVDRKRAARLWFPYIDGPKRERTPEIIYHGAKLRCYESKVPAVIQFLHASGIDPSGIVSIDTDRIQSRIPGDRALCKNHIRIHWRAVTKSTEIEACSIPLEVDSMDIEASSSHGDFPMAIKNYAMTTRELIQMSDRCKRGEWDVRGWIAAALGIGEPVPGISQVELKGRWDHMEKKRIPLDPLVLHTAVEKLLKAKCPKPPKRRVIDDYFRRFVGGNGDLDGETDSADDGLDSFDAASVTAGSDCDTMSVASGDSAMTPSHNVFGPEGVLALPIDHKKKVVMLNEMLDAWLPKQEGDKVTYIGIVRGTTDPTDPRRELCFCLPKVSPKNARCELIQCSSERDLLLKYRDWKIRNPADLEIGYNTFGFDYGFMADRALELGIQVEFLSMTLSQTLVCADKIKPAKGGGYRIHETTITLASGEHCFRQIRVPGMVNVDLYNQFRKEVQSDSYSLNAMAARFLGGKVKAVEATATSTDTDGNPECIVTLDDTQGVVEGGMIALEQKGGDPERRVVQEVDGERVRISGAPNMEWNSWGHAKDDVSPQDIFELSSNGNPEDATIVANYCKQDCALVFGLFDKVDSFTALTEMSNVSCVPLEYLILRGQGIKLTSVLVRECNRHGRIVEDISKDHPDEPYDGAIVLEPHTGIHRDPVTCLDYSSLYPSADISDNVSHETIKWYEQRDLNGNLVKTVGDRHGPLAAGHHLITREFPTYKRISVPKKTGGGFKKVKVPTGHRTVGIVQFPLGEHGMMPTVLSTLLHQRKTTRKRAKHKRLTLKDGTVYEGGMMLDDNGKLVPPDDGHYEILTDDMGIVQVAIDDVAEVEWRFSEFIRNVLEKRQLSYKILANSLYGGTGAMTSNFYEPNVAALITAIGRTLLGYAKKVMEGIYKQRRVIIADEPYIVTATCIYGDTDSVFVKWRIEVAEGHTTLPVGTLVQGKDALPLAIEISQKAEKLASACLRKPHTLEYEKTFLPWILLTRKRYAGYLYVTAEDERKLKSMGVVLRRQDNARIVKILYFKVLENLLNIDLRKSYSLCIEAFRKVIRGEVDRKDLTVSKSLRGHYANPERIAHKVLADRIAERDPGNAPRPGSRIEYVFKNVTDDKLKQKDRIDLPESVGDDIDYRYYVDHQLMTPIAQLFALELEELPEAQKHCPAAAFRQGATLNVRTKAVEKLMRSMLTSSKQRIMTEFFTPKPKTKIKSKKK